MNAMATRRSSQTPKRGSSSRASAKAPAAKTTRTKAVERAEVGANKRGARAQSVASAKPMASSRILRDAARSSVVPTKAAPSKKISPAKKAPTGRAASLKGAGARKKLSPGKKIAAAKVLAEKRKSSRQKTSSRKEPAITSKVVIRKKPAGKKSAAQTTVAAKKAAAERRKTKGVENQMVPVNHVASRGSKPLNGQAPGKKSAVLANVTQRILSDLLGLSAEEIESRAKAVPRRARPSRKRPTSLPVGHEKIPVILGEGEPVETEIAVQAIRAAFKAHEEHPIRGRVFLGVRSRKDIPQEGELDYALAKQAQLAAEEVVAAHAAARAREQAVEDRIADVYLAAAQVSDPKLEEVQLVPVPPAKDLLSQNGVASGVVLGDPRSGLKHDTHVIDVAADSSEDETDAKDESDADHRLEVERGDLVEEDRHSSGPPVIDDEGDTVDQDDDLLDDDVSLGDDDLDGVEDDEDLDDDEKV